jgi:hypothetical protein
MRLDDEDFQTVAALIADKVNSQDSRVVDAMELLSRQRKDDPNSPLIPDLEDQIETFERDRDNLSRIHDEFAAELQRPATLV